MTAPGSRPSFLPVGEIRARKQTAGRYGFVLGCVACVITSAINLSRVPRPWTLSMAVLAVLMAALNIPLGIAFGLFGEWVSRPRS